MITSKKTEVWDTKTYGANLKNQDYHHAFLYGEKLFNLNQILKNYMKL